MCCYVTGTLKRTVKRLAVFQLAVFVLTSFSFSALANNPIVAIEGRTMGTTYHIKWLNNPSLGLEPSHMKDLIDSKLGDINQAMSTYIKDSELSLFNQSAIGSEQKVSSELYDVIALAQRISADSKGAYDISVGPLINLWGFGPYKKVIKAPSEQRIKEVRQRVGFQHLELLGHGRMKKHVDLSLDLSSIAKGYAVDQIANILSEQGLTAFLVEIGGELVTRGLKADNKPWKIAVESPTSKRQIQRIVRVDDIAVATSGDYRNYFEEKGVRYSHIIDTITGKPITHRLASVTVLADNCALADALATAFLAMGTEKAFQYAIDNGIDALFISKAGNGFEEKVTAGFAKRILQ